MAQKINFLSISFQPPSIGTLSEAFGRRFGEEKLIRMEQRLLAESFKLDISIPTRHAFSAVFIKAGQLSDKERLLADYLVDISYLDFNLFYIRASKVSAACVHLALQVEIINIDSPLFQWYFPLLPFPFPFHRCCDNRAKSCGVRHSCRPPGIPRRTS